MNDDTNPPFDCGTLIYSYTREQALEDGFLIDVSEMAKEAGFRYPVALTNTLWADIHAIPESKAWQDAKGRLWDVLWMALAAIRADKAGGSQLVYKLIMPVGRTTYYRVKLVCGPGDAGEPVITLMRPDED